MRMKRNVCVMLFVVCCLALCFQTGWAQNPKEIKIGTILPTTGPLSPLGINARNGCDLAAMEINEAGGIKALGGAKIKMVHGDSEGKADTGISVAERLVKQEGIIACVSGPQSGVTFATTQVTEKYKIPHMCTASVADEITQRGFKYVFRDLPNSTVWSISQIDFINSMRKKGHNIKKLAFLYEDTLWGQGQAKIWKENKGDMDIVADLTYPNGTSDLSVTIAKLKAAKPDIVLAVSYVSDAILITKTMFELDFNCQAVIGSAAGQEDPQYYKNLKELSENVITLSSFSQEMRNPLCKTVVQKYNSVFKIPMTGQTSGSYAAIYIFADALERAGSADPTKLRDALSKTNLCSGPALIIPVKCIQFDATGQILMKPILIQWRGGKLMPIYPEDQAVTNAIWPMPTWKERGLKK